MMVIVILLFLSLQTILPSFIPIEANIKHLRCFQCTSDSRDLLPVCDTEFWRLTKAKERDKVSLYCHINESKFCSKRVELKSNYRLTERSCSGTVDNFGFEVKEGCLDMPNDVQVCMCSTDNCNLAKMLVMNQRIMFISICLIYYHNKKRN